MSCTKPLGEQDLLSEDPATTAPEAFDLLSPQRVNQDLLVAWSSAKGASSYEVLYGTATGNYTQKITAQRSPAGITGLTSGTTYYIRVKAINPIGETLSTSEKVYPFMGPPGDFTITSAAPGNGQVTLTWAASPEATSYTVMSGLSADAVNVPVSTNATSPYVISSLTNSVTYYFTVTAKNTLGSKLVGPVSATPNVPPTAPLNPAFTAELGKCILSWSPPASGAPPITYTVRRVVAPSVTVPVCQNISTRTCEEDGLTNGTYDYTIEAINGAGPGPTASITCSLNPPGAVTFANPPVANKKAVLTWTGGAGATSFTVQYGTTNPPTLTASTSATSPYTIENLTNTVLYYYRVIAVNSYGSTNSTVRSSTPNSTAPTITMSGYTQATSVTMDGPLNRRFTIADQDPEDTVDCGTSVSITSSDPGIVPQNNISVGGSGLQCSFTATPAPAARGYTTLTISVTDGSATGTRTINVQALPAARRIYSLRKHGSYAGPGVRLRRASDSNEADIYFDANGILNQTSVTTFLGGSNGFVVRWYDQGIDGVDAVQTTASRQPRLVFTSNVPTITPDGVDDMLEIPSFPATAAVSVFANFRRNTQNPEAALLSYGSKDAGSYSGFHLHKNASNQWRLHSALDVNTLETTNGPSSDTSERGIAFVFNPGTSKRDFVISTAATATRTTGTVSFYDGPLAGTSAYLFSGGTAGNTQPINGIMKELIVFDQLLSDAEIRSLTSQYQ